MIKMSLQATEILLGCPGQQSGVSFNGIATDSRMLKSGMLFAALSGERADGHDFIASVIKDGAVAVLVNKSLDLPVPQLVVGDVLAALGTLAAHWRSEINPFVIGITGSNGKTTTREMVANILELGAPVHATSGNYNNELGLPLTLFDLDHGHEISVLELGAGKAGDIKYLTRICAPDLGMVTNVGPAHLQGFGNEEGVARAKGELYEALPSNGFAIINADEKWSDLWREMSAAKNIITFGRQQDCDVFPLQTGSSTTIRTPLGEFQLQLHLPGDHNLQNALAATSVAIALNISLDQILKGLENTRPVPGRLNMVHTVNGWTVIDDTYNANPASLYAALQVLSNQPGEAWLVLGDMKELGTGSRKMHAEMGDSARALGVKRIFALGDSTAFTVDAFGPGAWHFDDHAALIDALRSELAPDVTCLVKGSRSMGMEQVVEAISEAYPMRETG